MKTIKVFNNSIFSRKSKNGGSYVLQTSRGDSISSVCLGRYSSLAGNEEYLYSRLKQSVPVIDAAVSKLVRLTGGFKAECDDADVNEQLEYFLNTVKVGAFGMGIESFINTYLEQLLTYGTAIGEIVPSKNKTCIKALYNAPLNSVEIERTGKSPMDVRLCCKSAGEYIPIKNTEFILMTALNPEPGEIKGVSLLRGLPFISSILMNIYNTIGLNWERMGNLRYAVTYNPGNDGMDKAFAKERAMQIASEWTKAMENSKNGRVSDFIAVGDVSIKVIGADNQIIDSKVPVRQLLEQIVAKLGVPPFLLGLSWSTTEKMSVQQADILTSELECYRRYLTPVIERICNTQLRMNGYFKKCRVVWQPINLQDCVEEARAKLYEAQANRIINKE